MFWNGNEVQCSADQASIQPHGHRSPDGQRIVPGNSRKSRSEYKYARLMAFMILENKHVTLGDQHFDSGSPPLEETSSFIVSISIPCGAPSITIVVLPHLVPNACS